jgi:hypothetical protein
VGTYAAILIVVSCLRTQTPSQSLPNTVDLAARNRAESQLARERSVRLELTKAMEFRKVKQGDRVVAELMENLEFDGRVIVARGAKVEGRILEVRREEGNSAVVLGFDRAVSKGLNLSLSATIKAIGTPLEIYSAHWASNRSSQGNSEALSVHGRLANNAQGVWGLPGIALEEAGPQRSMLRSKGKDGALQPRTQIILRITKP